MVVYNPSSNFEKVVIDQWLEAKILKVEDRIESKTWKDKETGIDNTRDVMEIRFVFGVKGYNSPKNSRWFTLSTAEKANLYKFLQTLVPDLLPNTAIDTDKLVGMMVKLMFGDWKNPKTGKTYQNIVLAKPLDNISAKDIMPTEDPLKAEAQKEVQVEENVSNDFLEDDLPF